METLLVQGKFVVRLDRGRSRLVLFIDGHPTLFRGTLPDDSHGALMIDLDGIVREAVNKFGT